VGQKNENEKRELNVVTIGHGKKIDGQAGTQIMIILLFSIASIYILIKSGKKNNLCGFFSRPLN